MNEEETRRLAKIIRKGHPRRPGSAANRARNKLVEAFMPLANRFMKDDDKYQQALIQLIESAETWDPKSGLSFRLYAKVNIRPSRNRKKLDVSVEYTTWLLDRDAHDDLPLSIRRDQKTLLQGCVEAQEPSNADILEGIIDKVQKSDLSMIEKFILIRRLHGDTQQLIAEELSIAQQTVSVRESEAIKKLRGMVPR